jgi:hypothetical protein
LPETRAVGLTLHTETPEEELARRGAEGAARRLVVIGRDPGRDASACRRIESLIERWSKESDRDRELIRKARKAPAQGET